MILGAGGMGLLVSAALAKSENLLPPDLSGQGWEEITFDGKTPNTYASCGDGCVEIVTNSSVSMIGRDVMATLAETPVLHWEWRIENPVPTSDLSKKGVDDRAVALYVTFPYDPDEASFSEKLLRPIVELARGKDAPGRVLSYVWGGFGKVGDAVESPFFGAMNAMIISRNQSAPVGEWVRERVDILADHERIFGSGPATTAHILLSADSDDTGTPNRAHVRRIEFRDR